MNSKLISQLSQIDTFYSQVKANVPEFFDAYEKATSKSNKIIHKQGFDTFYLPHQNPMCGIKIDKEKENQFFVEFVTDVQHQIASGALRPVVTDVVGQHAGREVGGAVQQVVGGDVDVALSFFEQLAAER